MEKKSKINYFVLFILVSLIYIFCLSTEILSPFHTNFAFMIYAVITSVFLFSECRKSHHLFDLICFALYFL